VNENISDFKAQVAANHRGILLMKSLISEYSLIYVQAYMQHIMQNAEETVRAMLCALSLKNNLPEVGTIEATDYMDDGSQINLKLTIDRVARSAKFDFSDTSYEILGNVNAPRAITYSAIIYCLRCLVNSDIPLNQGCLNPIKVKIVEGSLLDPNEKAAVVGGNVLTS